MLNRRMSDGRVNRSTSRHGSGRGPTSDMSPRSTFKSCGNSSIDVLRNSRPSRRHPRIVPDLEHRAVRLVLCFQRRLQLFRVGDHRPELVHPERPLLRP